MITYFTWEGILLATVAGFVVGSIWYSPVLFMKTWLSVQGFTKETMPKRGVRYIFLVMVYSFLAHGCMISVTALILQLLSVATLPLALYVTLLMAFGFIVPVKFLEMIYNLSAKHYEKKIQLRFLIDTSYLVVVLLIMTTVLYSISK